MVAPAAPDTEAAAAAGVLVRAARSRQTRRPSAFQRHDAPVRDAGAARGTAEDGASRDL